MPATAARKAFVGQALRFETAAGVSATASPSSTELERETCLDVLANAATLASSQASLYSIGRRLYSLTAFQVQHRLKIGDTITLDDQNFAAAKDVIVWSITERAAAGKRVTDLVVYG